MKNNIIDEIADFTPIPKWFTKHLKQLKKKKMVIMWSRSTGKNSFYKFWKENRL